MIMIIVIILLADNTNVLFNHNTKYTNTAHVNDTTWVFLLPRQRLLRLLLRDAGPGERRHGPVADQARARRRRRDARRSGVRG